MSCTMIFPYPNSGLLPNSNLHFREKAKLKKVLRQACHCISHVKAIADLDPTKNMPLKIVFYMPHARCDLDNLLAAYKSGIDGLADGLKLNDRRFRPLIVDCLVFPSKPHVEITIYDHHEIPDWLQSKT